MTTMELLEEYGYCSLIKRCVDQCQFTDNGIDNGTEKDF